MRVSPVYLGCAMWLPFIQAQHLGADTRVAGYGCSDSSSSTLPVHMFGILCTGSGVILIGCSWGACHALDAVNASVMQRCLKPQREQRISAGMDSLQRMTHVSRCQYTRRRNGAEQRLNEADWCGSVMLAALRLKRYSKKATCQVPH